MMFPHAPYNTYLKDNPIGKLAGFVFLGLGVVMLLEKSISLFKGRDAHLQRMYRDLDDSQQKHWHRLKSDLDRHYEGRER